MAQLVVEDSTDADTGAHQKSIYYERHGQPHADKQTILLAHGWGMSLRAWDDTSSWLVDRGHSVIAYDQRNCGQSSKDFADASIEALTRDLVALLDALSIDEVVLNGWSLGGAVVVGAAPALDKRLKGLICTCGATPRYTRAQGFEHGATAADVEATVAGLRADRVNFLHGLYHDGVFAKPVSDAVKAWAYGLALQGSPAADASLAALATVDQRDIMARLNVPALIVVGTDDGVVDSNVGRFAANLLPAGELVEMPGCGHAPFIEDPPVYRETIAAFIGKLR